MITLYDYYRSTASYRVRIALNYKNISYQTKAVNLIGDGGEQHQAFYKALNPQSLVPCLEDSDRSLVLSQSLCIIEYLEETYPAPALLPKGPILRAQTRRIANIIACDVHPLNNLRVLQYLKHTLNQSEEVRTEWYHHWLKLGFDTIETLLTQSSAHPYCMGKDITLADVFLIPQVYNARRFNFSLEAYPKITEIEQACLKHPAFDKAKPENQAQEG